MFNLLKTLKNRTPLGWLQLTHDRPRLLVALAGIAFSDILIFMQLGFQTALYHSNTRLHTYLDAEIVLMSPKARNIVNLDMIPRRRLYQSLDIPGVISAEPVYVQFAEWKTPQTRKQTTILAIGFNPDKPAFILPEVIEQAPLLKFPRHVIFDRGARGNYDETIAKIDAGQRVPTEIENSNIDIAGLFQIGASFAADGTVMMSDRTFMQLFSHRRPEALSLGLLQLEPGRNPGEIAETLANHLPEDVTVLTKAEFVEFERQYWAMNTPVGFVFSLGTVMGLIVGTVIVYQVLATDVRDRLPEYATFKAMGYRNRYLLAIVFEQALILAVMGFIPGATVSVGLYALTREATNLPLMMTTIRAIQVLIFTILMCAVSGAIATRKLQAADPAEIFG